MSPKVRFFREKPVQYASMTAFGVGNGLCMASFALALSAPVDPLMIAPAVVLGFAGALTATVGAAGGLAHSIANGH